MSGLDFKAQAPIKLTINRYLGRNQSRALVNSSPLWLAVLARIFLKEGIRRLTLIGKWPGI